MILIGIVFCIIGVILIFYAIYISKDNDSKQSTSNSPVWAAELTYKKYTLFLKEIQRYVQNRQLTFSIEDGQLKLSEDSSQSYELATLVNKCSKAPLRDYRNIVEEYFDASLQSGTIL